MESPPASVVIHVYCLLANCLVSPLNLLYPLLRLLYLLIIIIAMLKFLQLGENYENIVNYALICTPYNVSSAVNMHFYFFLLSLLSYITFDLLH